VASTQSSRSNDLEGLENILRRIEAEPSDAVRARERNTFDNIAGPYKEKLVLFGAGPLGRGVLAGLRKTKVQPLAFADNNGKLWGTEVMGLPVLSPAQAAKQYGKSACFVVTIYQGSDVRRQLASMGCERITP
jgi:FlaA1/EpsC-like NDP-sugar epimerase